MASLVEVRYVLNEEQIFEWNEEGQSYLIPTGIVSNPNTDETKVIKEVTCKECHPIAFNVLREIDEKNRILKTAIPKPPSGNVIPGDRKLQLKRKHEADWISPTMMMENMLPDSQTPDESEQCNTIESYGIYSRGLETPIALNNLNGLGLIRVVKQHLRMHEDDNRHILVSAPQEHSGETPGYLGFEEFTSLCKDFCKIRDQSIISMSWSIFTRGSNNTQLVLSEFLEEIKQQLAHKAIVSLFAKTCFSLFDPEGTGQIRRFNLLWPPPEHTLLLSPSQLHRLRRIFEDSDVYELSFYGFCHLLRTDTELLSVFIGILFSIMKVPLRQIKGRGKSQYRRSRSRHQSQGRWSMISRESSKGSLMSMSPPSSWVTFPSRKSRSKRVM